MSIFNYYFGGQELTTREKLRIALIPPLLLLCTLLILITRRMAKRKTPFDKIPGPRLYPFGSFLNMLELMDRRQLIPKMATWCKKYGPVMKLRVGPIEGIILTSPDHIQALFSSMEPTHWSKPWFPLDAVKPVSWFDGLLHAKGLKWKSRRKLINPILSQKSVLRYIPIFNEESKQAVRNLGKLYELDHSPRPIQSVIFCAALNCICKAAFGVDIEKGEVMYDAETIFGKIRRFFDIITIRLYTPWLFPNFLFQFHPLAKEMNNLLQEAKRFVSTLQEKFGKDEQERSTSMLYGLVKAGLDFKGIFEEVLTMIVAGYETTGGTLHHLLFLLALHPEIQERCRQEVDLVFGNEEWCPSGEISYEGVKQLQYLEQCVLESLRRMPALGGMLRKIDSPLRLDENLELPAGTNINVYLVYLNMNPKYFPDPQKYNPDRFLPEEIEKRHPHAFVPFSSGPRICIGYKLAMIEVLILCARILRHFVIRTTDKLEDVVWIQTATLLPESPMNFVLEKREHADL